MTPGTNSAPAARGWKYYLGLTLFIYGLVPYELALVVPFLGLRASVAAGLAAGIVITGEISFFASVALLGKPFLEAIKARIHKLFRRPGPVPPPQPVSRRRHNIGVVLFFASFLPYFAAEAALLMGWAQPDYVGVIIGLLLASDLTFVVSLFVLGGDFWARLKQLFEWQETPPTGLTE